MEAQVINLADYRKPKPAPEQPISTEPSLEERLDRIKHSVERINELMAELRRNDEVKR